MTPPSKDTLSRRRFLQVTAAGLAAAVASVGFELTPEQARALAARRQSGTLRVAWGTPATLDPLTASADSEIAFLNAVYDYLIDTDAGSNLVPRLAESWEASADGLTYTLKIREGVSFHDGSPLTLDDVLWTFEYLRGTEGPVKDLLSVIASIEAGEGNTLVITLSNTNPDFPYLLGDNHIVILQKDAADIGTAFNGTGPFMVSEYDPGNRAVLTANPNYWGEPASIATLEFVFFADPQAMISALQGGQVDVVLRMDNATFASLTGDANFTAVDIPTNGHDLCRLRADREPGNNPLVQQAFKLATERQAIYERIQLGFGAVGKDTPIGPLFAQYYDDTLELPARDPEAAKQLLADAGYPDGLDITMYVPNSGDRPALASALAAQWEEAGIRVSIELQDEATYYADNGWLEVDLGITGWGSRPVPQFYLDFYVKSGAVWNEAHFSDPEVDALIEVAGSSLDQAERIQAYKDIQRILIERGPFIICYFFAQFMVHDAAISGINLHPFAGRTRFDTAVI